MPSALANISTMEAQVPAENMDIVDRLKQRIYVSGTELNAHQHSHPLLNRKILFKESKRLQALIENKEHIFKKKYHVINSKAISHQAPTKKPLDNSLQRSSRVSKQLFEDVEIPAPSFVIFDHSKLSMCWEIVRPIGPGRSKSFCLLCVFQDHVISCIGQKQMRGVVAPKRIVGSLKSIAKHMKLGRQEDAHEFTRYFIDALVKPCLLGYERADPISKQTTPLHQMFGGYLRSQVECQSCKGTSNTFDPLLDLSLEIRHCNSLEKALSHFTKSEMLVRDNQYKCEKCKKKSNARKQITIAKPPAVLTIQLKRFDFTFSSRGDKLNKPVQYPESFDILPYTSFASSLNNSTEKRSKMMYDLYAVLVHAGSTCVSGHYYCFVKNSNGTWYCMDDADVTQVSSSQALQQKGAYMLFYTQRSSMANKKQVSTSIKSTADNLNAKQSQNQPKQSKTEPLQSVEIFKKRYADSPPPSDAEKQPPKSISIHGQNARILTPPSSPDLPTVTKTIKKECLPAVTKTITDKKECLPAMTKTVVDKKVHVKENLLSPVVINPPMAKGWSVQEVKATKATSLQTNNSNEFQNGIYDEAVAQWDEFVDHKADLFRYNVIEEHKSHMKRKRPTKEDLEYDKGRTKKVRRNRLNNWIVKSI